MTAQMNSLKDRLYAAREKRARLETAFTQAINMTSDRRATFDLYIPKLAEVNADIIELSGQIEKAA